MIDTEREQLFPLSALAREVPNRRGSTGISAATIWRWAQRGCKGVRLESVLCGGIRMGSREAVHRFFAAVTAAANGEASPIRTDKQRQRAIEQANQELDDAGI